MKKIHTPQFLNQFLLLAEHHKLDEIENLCQGYDINEQDDLGDTLLMYTIRHGYSNANVVKLLIKLGTDIRAKNNAGYTAACLALFFDRIDIFNVLSQNTNILSDLMLSLAVIDINIVAKLLEYHFEGLVAELVTQKPSLLNEKNAEGDNLLIIAAIHNLPTITEFLLNKGASITAKDPFGKTVFEYAQPGSQVLDLLNLRKKLYSAEGSPVERDIRGNTEIYHSISMKYSEKSIKRELDSGVPVNARNYRGSTALLFAAYGRYYIYERFLLEHGADINLANVYGCTPLIISVRKSLNIPTTVNLLLRYKPNLEAATDDGCTALLHAVKKNYPEIALTLLKAGANINTCDNLHQTPVITAVLLGHMKVLKTLLEYREKPNLEATTLDGYTALHYAIKLNRLDMVKLLLSKNANINTVNVHTNHSPLLVGVLNGHIKIVRLLLEQATEPDLEIKDIDGNTALFHAVETNQIDMVEQLHAAGADINTVNNLGQTPVMLARLRGHANIVKLLTPQASPAHYINGSLFGHQSQDASALGQPSLPDAKILSPSETTTYLQNRDSDPFSNPASNPRLQINKRAGR